MRIIWHRSRICIIIKYARYQPNCYLGIYAAKIKCIDVENAHSFFKLNKKISVSTMQNDPVGNKHFWIKDAQGNIFNIVSSTDWFKQSSKKTGAVTGAVIGVSNMQQSLIFYKDFLGIAEIVYDIEGEFYDNDSITETYCRRVLLRKKHRVRALLINYWGP